MKLACCDQCRRICLNLSEILCCWMVRYTAQTASQWHTCYKSDILCLIFLEAIWRLVLCVSTIFVVDY